MLPILMGDVGRDGAELSAPLSQNRGNNSFTGHDFLGEGNGGRVVMRRGTAMPAGLQVTPLPR